MIRKILFLIGLLLLLPLSAHAEELPSLCRPAVGAASEKPLPGAKLYNGIYCEVVKTSSQDETFKNTAFALGFPEKTVKGILEGSGYKCDDIPKEFKDKYFEGDKSCSNINNANNLLEKVEKVYRKEKVYADWKASIKPQLKAKEVWMNGTTLDSSFDLIVDLNLAEFVMFGSQAQWTEDVYYFPGEDGTPGSKGRDEGVPEEGTATTSTTGFGEPPSPTTPPPAEESIPENVICVPPEDPRADFPPIGAEEEEGEAGTGTGEGSELVCRDPQSVNLRKYAAPKTEGEPSTGGGEEEGLIDCPPGSVPSRPLGDITPTVKEILTGEAAAGLETTAATQSGRVSGGLKKITPVTKPECPPGYTKIGAAAFGRDLGEEDLCIPVVTFKNCPLGFDEARKILNGGETIENLDKNSAKYKALQAIEAQFCIFGPEEGKRQRAEYAYDEGCIDCHLSIMMDILGDLRFQNVAPMENTKNTFGISSRWKPKLAFDMEIYVKTKLLPHLWDSKKTAAQKLESELKKEGQKAAKQADPNDEKCPPVPANAALSGSAISDSCKAKEEAVAQKKQEAINQRAAVIEIANDQTFNAHILEMLVHMKSVFEQIRADFNGLYGLKEKGIQECKC